MIVTLTGANSWALRRQLKTIVDRFVAEHGELALERLDGEEADLGRIREAVTSLPFLASKKMVVLRRPGTNKQFMEAAEALLKEVPETTDVIIVEPKLDKRLGYYKFLKKTTDYQEFAALDSNGLARWLMQAAKDQGGSLSSNDARYLVERVGLDQQQLVNELDKLLLHDQKISRQSIELLTEPAPQSTIFQLLEAAFAGRPKRTLQLYGEQRALKVEPPQIVAMLAWQLHILAVIKAAGQRNPAQIAREARLSPYVVQKSAAIAGKLSLSALKDMVDSLLRIDVRSKRDGIDPDEALQHYLLSIALN